MISKSGAGAVDVGGASPAALRAAAGVRGSPSSRTRSLGGGLRKAAGKGGTAGRDGAVVVPVRCGDKRRRGDGAEDTAGGEAMMAGEDAEARQARETLEFKLKLSALYKRFQVEARQHARALCERGGHSNPLLEHTVNVLASTTLSGSQNKTYAWCHWCLWRYKRGVPSLVQTLEKWPPTCIDWQEYELYTRKQTGSNDAARVRVGQACTVAGEYWCGKEPGLFKSAEECSPIHLYGVGHRKAVAIARRAVERTTEQVKAVTMDEARSGPHFCDDTSYLGLQHGAAWTCGCIMGGKRPNTVAAIRAGDVVFIVAERVVGVARRVQRVVELRVRFRQEKFDDIIADRSLGDVPPDPLKEGEVKESFGYWCYAMLRARRLFASDDPLVQEPLGTVFQVRLECREFYLFCKTSVDGLCWVDTVPVDVAALSRWCQLVLTRLGSEPRGFSAHRSGFVTRAVTLHLLETRGAQMAEDTLAAIVRAGGWEAESGKKTVGKTYTRAAADAHINTQLLGLGKDGTNAVFSRRHQEYVKDGRRPDVPPVNRVGGGTLGAVTWCARLPEVQYLQARVNAFGRAMVEAAMGDVSIMPLRRFMPDAGAVRAARSKGVSEVWEFEEAWHELGMVMLERVRGSEAVKKRRRMAR
jgi:hypothetical protein